MKLLINRLGSFLTGDDLADAVLDYGLALARQRQLDLVEVPYRGDDGSIARVRMTVGWCADTTSVESASSREAHDDELVEPDTTLAMYDKAAKAASVGAIRATAFSTADATQLDWDVDLSQQL
ncbi:hypothetical protein [Agromyces sp. CCNWLW203]|uniref:hypothetical protein n=1 Tax=Agromyces sp. CCNWLW203 TaxID=3112842 RepID=UPI002F962753